MALPTDLTTLANVKAWANVQSTADDAVLTGLISSISLKILTYLQRQSILPVTYTEIRNDIGRHDSLMLRQWPVVSVASVAINGVTVPQWTITSTPPSYWGVGWMLEQVNPFPPSRQALLYIRGYGGWHWLNQPQSTVITYSAGYQISAEVQTIPPTPYQVIPFQPYGVWASDQGVTYVSTGAALTAVTGAPAVGQYSVAVGVYTFNVADVANQVSISYGYVPLQLAEACNEWVSERYKYRSRIGQASVTLGGQETSSFIPQRLPEYIRETIDPFRSVVTVAS